MAEFWERYVEQMVDATARLEAENERLRAENERLQIEVVRLETENQEARDFLAPLTRIWQDDTVYDELAVRGDDGGDSA